MSDSLTKPTKEKRAVKTAAIPFRLTPQRRRQIRILAIERGESVQQMLERGLELVLALAQTQEGKTK